MGVLIFFYCNNRPEAGLAFPLYTGKSFSQPPRTCKEINNRVLMRFHILVFNLPISLFYPSLYIGATKTPPHYLKSRNLPFAARE